MQTLEARLEKLDRDLAIDQKNRIEEIFLRRGNEYRIRCTVFRVYPGFRAAAKIAGQTFVYNGDTPSNAFLKLAEAVKFAVNAMEFQKNVASAKYVRRFGMESA